VIGGKDRGDSREPYHGLQRQPQWRRWASGGKGQRRQAKLIVVAAQKQKCEVEVGSERGEARGRSRHLL
jgi:hypothetical protein